MKVMGFNIQVRPAVHPLRLVRKATDVRQLRKIATPMVERMTGRFEKARRRAEQIAGRFIFLRERLLGETAYQVRMNDEGWMIAESGSNIPLHVFPKKQDAIRMAKKMAREHRAQLDVFTKTGDLQQRHSFA